MNNYSQSTSRVNEIVNKISLEYSTLVSELSEYEMSIIGRVLEFNRTSTPTMLGSILQVIDDCIELRDELNYILYTLRNKYQEVNHEYNKLYYTQYSRIAKMGRPNQATVESDVYSYNSGQINEFKYKVARYLDLINLFEFELTLLRSKERLADSKRQTLLKY